MNDEIKVILDKLKDREETYKFCKQYKLAINDWIYEAHYLLNYITKLQTIEREYSAILSENAELQQENERLKERVAYLERSNNRREDTIIGLRFEVAEQEDYKSRCEKAIEYIKQNSQMTDLNIYGIEDVLCFIGNADKLLNILQNGDNSNER